MPSDSFESRESERLQATTTRSVLSALVPAAAAFVVYKLVNFFFKAAAIEATVFGKDTGVGEVVGLSALPARLFWAEAATVYCLVWACALAVILSEIWRCARRESWLVRLIATALALAAIALGPVVGAEHPLTLYSIRPLLEATFEKLEILHGPLLLYLFNGLWIATKFLLVVAAACALGFPLSGERTAKVVRERLKGLDRCLYAGAAVLVAGVVQTHLMHELPISLLDAGSEAYQTAAEAISLAVGALWSLMLLAIYVPAALLLRQQGLELATQAVGRDRRELADGWLEEHGMAVSLTEHMARITALMAPLLAGGPLIQLLGLARG